MREKERERDRDRDRDRDSGSYYHPYSVLQDSGPSISDDMLLADLLQQMVRTCSEEIRNI